MRVLGIDPGSRRTGYGLVEGGGNLFRCLEHGEARPPARLALPRRLCAIVERVGEVMDRVRPDCVAVEVALCHLHRERLRAPAARAMSAAATRLEALLARRVAQ